MTTNQTVNKEAIRILVADVGYTKASQQLNIKRDTLYKWGQRKGWKQPIQHAQETVQCVQSPGDAHAAFIQSNEKRTRWSLSRAHRLQAAKAARGKLGPKETLQVAQGAAITHGWKTQEAGQTQVAVNIAILDSAPVT